MTMARSIAVMMMMMFALPACGEGGPDVDDVRSELESDFAELQIDRFISVGDIKMLETTAEGDGTYTVEVEYQMVFRKDFDESRQELNDMPEPSTYEEMEVSNHLHDLFLSLRKVHGSKWKAGDTITETATGTFEKTDEGWVRN